MKKELAFHPWHHTRKIIHEIIISKRCKFILTCPINIAESITFIGLIKLNGLNWGIISFHKGDVLTGTGGLLEEILASIGRSIRDAGLSPCISVNCVSLKIIL